MMPRIAEGLPRLGSDLINFYGSVALHFEGHQALLAGDVLCSRNPLTGRKGVQLMPAAFATSSSRALESLAAARATGKT